MTDTTAKKKRLSKKKIILSSIALVLFILVIGVVKYLTFCLPADEEALAAMVTNEEVIVEEIGNTIVFTPIDQTPTIGYIYYPGGQVEPESFAYAASEIAKSGIKVIIQRMPFNLAMFGKDRAFDVMDTYTDIEEWYIGGFSLGGVSACMAASENMEAFEGVILYASYTTESYSLADSGLKVLSLSGSNDGLATPTKIENGKEFLPEDTVYIQISGGNHTQMAIYGEGDLQKGDNEAGLSRMKQQEILVEETSDFILQEGAAVN
ncbi:alpha/beta hydrolase [Konateibacter massiliensis]|uniref:alpha/beta hydrolase n=1 Tax=Konateibacter massiliensis TaxID=2002841 RepID=UPI000C15E949|nr:alpha/beta hydrolase [Konateibacter massiliensis]